MAGAPDEASEALARQLVELVVGHMRADGLFNLDTFLRAVESGMGGTIIIRAPCGRTRREIPEARYMPEVVRITGQFDEDGAA